MTMTVKSAEDRKTEERREAAVRRAPARARTSLIAGLSTSPPLRHGRGNGVGFSPSASAGGKCTRWPGLAPESTAKRKISLPPGPLARTMPSLVPNFIFRGGKVDDADHQPADELLRACKPP